MTLEEISAASRVHHSGQLRDPLDLRIQGLEALHERGVTTIDVIDVVNFCRAICTQAGKDQSRTCTDIRRPHRRARQTLDAAHPHVVAIGTSIRPEPHHLVDEAESRFEDVLGNHRRALGDGRKPDCQWLDIGREPRERQRREIDGPRTIFLNDAEPTRFDGDV